jgi:hypothetical protein
MINCPTCEFADFKKDKCKRLLTRLPHVCPYAEERKPRNNFEEIKAMSPEQFAKWIVTIEMRILKCNPMLERPALEED